MRDYAVFVAGRRIGAAGGRRAKLIYLWALVALLLSPGALAAPVAAGADTAAEDPEATCPAGGQCFADVPSGNPFYEFANRLFQQDIITGYPCGGPGEPCDAENRPYYRPGDDVTRQQMAKFVDNARHLPGISIDTASDARPIYVRTSAESGTAVYGESSGVGVYGEGHGGAGVRGVGSCPAGICETSAGVFGSSANDDGVRGISTANNGRGVYGTANNGATAVGVYGSSGTGDGVYGTTSAPLGFGVQGNSTATDGTGVQGVASNGINATGVRGHSNSGIGIFGSSTAADKSGVRGSASGVDGIGVSGVANNGVGATGVLGSSTSGSGMYGYSSAVTGRGVFGVANGGDDAVGVFGMSTTGTGVYGTSSDYAGVGLYGRANAPDAISVFGITTDGIGVAGSSTNGDGVFGFSSGGRAGYFVGDVEVTGTCCAAGAGTYRIDHPLDPKNKYLYHAAVQSSELKDIYDGMVVLDSGGVAWVSLPEWFDGLNTEFRYQLTAIGVSMPDLHIAEEIQDNRFKVAGGKPNFKVSWMVTGIRHDPYAIDNPILVEQDKTKEERGLYIHPTAWGQPESKGVTYEVTQPLQNEP